MAASTPSFVVPVKKVKRFTDLEAWKNSRASHDVVGFILAVNEAVRGRALDEDRVRSQVWLGRLGFVAECYVLFFAVCLVG